ncbi:MAG: NPCBM/NEW2 domain-containing protein, partial [Armatimonadota bacterium]
MCVTLLLSLAIPSLAIVPDANELAASREWVESNFVRAPIAVRNGESSFQTGLIVLANYGSVQQNSRDGNPLKIGSQTYDNGLFCHAESRILVKLPSPGSHFNSVVGIDTNGAYGGGSIEFKVEVNGAAIAGSPVMHRGEPGFAIDADLAGAKEFILAVTNGGDNINSDQASWANALITLNDGSKIRLGDMPINNARPQERLLPNPPFSFMLGDKSSDELLGHWKFRESRKHLDAQREQITQQYTDPITGMRLKCIAVKYNTFPTVEWTLYFKNTGKQDTPILSNIKPLDVRLAKSGPKPIKLHHFLGSLCVPNDYQPFETQMIPGDIKHINTDGGRPTNSNLPYFNIENNRGGVIAVVGWSGQWVADFECGKDGSLRITGGQETTRFKLHPGEEVRTPMAVIQHYKGDWLRGQNIWRKWMIDLNIPKPDGKPIRPTASACNGNSYPGIITNPSEEMRFLSGYIREGIDLDYWWQDAGWYPCDPVGWAKTGTWEVDKTRWSKGIREVSDFCRKNDIKTIVWFEPERVFKDTWLWDNKPQWILMNGTDQGLLNLGDPECRIWLADHINKLMTKEGIDLYRQDFNIDPLQYWMQNDTEDRQGITEIKYVTGYLAYWDSLLRKRKGMLIDSCASGGRRNDLETLRRAVPLLRSDYTFEPVGEQCHTYGVSFWMPFNGTGFLTIDEYLIRSQM